MAARHILVVDDEPEIRNLVRDILEDEGYRTFVSTSGEEGLEKFKNIRPDATFVDIWLPGIDGLETMKRLLEIDPIQIVIMISGHGSITTAVRAVQEGAHNFLEKPLSLDRVLFVLKRGLEYRKVLEENRKLKSMLGDRDAEGSDPRDVIKKDSTGRIEFAVFDEAMDPAHEQDRRGNRLRPPSDPLGGAEPFRRDGEGPKGEEPGRNAEEPRPRRGEEPEGDRRRRGEHEEPARALPPRQRGRDRDEEEREARGEEDHEREDREALRLAMVPP